MMIMIAPVGSSGMAMVFSTSAQYLEGIFTVARVGSKRDSLFCWPPHIGKQGSNESKIE